jgi:hypothetical protein
MAAVDAKVRIRVPDASADASINGARRWPSLAQQRADALGELVSEGGATVATEVILLRALVHDDEARPINASGRHRHPTARQKRVVHERDRACVNCGATDLLEYDHDPPYEESHRTLVSELKGRCPICHHRRHANGDG